MPYWIVTVSQDNLAKILEHQIIGVPISSASTLSKIKKGDRIVIYISKKRQGYGGPKANVSEFGAICEVVDDKPFFSEEAIWYSRGEEKFPWRRKIKVISTKKVKVTSLLERLSFITKKQKWGAFFFKTIRPISDTDYETILKAMEE